MKYLLLSFIMLSGLSAFPSGKQFRPPAFNICKVKPDHEKCQKDKEDKEVKEAQLETEEDKKRK